MSFWTKVSGQMSFSQHIMVTSAGQNISGLYYKHVTIVNYTSSDVNKPRASLNDDTRVIIYDRHMFIVQATELVMVLSIEGVCELK